MWCNVVARTGRGGRATSGERLRVRRALLVAAAGDQPRAHRLQLHRRRDEPDVAAFLHQPPDPPVVVVLLLEFASLAV